MTATQHSMTSAPYVAPPPFGMSFTGVCNAFEPSDDLNRELEALDLRLSESEDLLHLWETYCREKQRPPGIELGAPDWTIWLILGGRGAGKTRTGAEWVRGAALGHPGICEPGAGRIALVGETYAAVRDVMVEGPSGILAVHRGRHDCPTWTPTLRRLAWPNGAVAHCFSSEDPDALRGPQFDAAWADELAKWRHAEETWDMLQFGLRLGTTPREIVTTTPKPIPLLKRLLAEPRVTVRRSGTEENAGNLAPGFLQAIVRRYAGTRLGRQELDGEIVEEREDALWSRDMLEAARVSVAPDLARVVVAVDPPASSGSRAASCGIVAAGIDADGTGYVLADASVTQAKPAEWAAKAIACYRRWHADALVVEANQGGEMVSAVIREVDPSVPVVNVHATRGKYLRAEPVALLYEQGRVLHVGAFPELEDEMCDFWLDGLSLGRSPDRLDALVWALTKLMLVGRGEPRVRTL